RYFPEPDLPPLVIAREQVEAIRAALPELPRARWLRLQQDYAVSAADAHLLSARAPEADYFEAVVAAGAAPKLAATWQLNELAGLCQRRHRSLEACGLAPERLAALLRLVAAGTINGGTAKELLAEAIETGADPAELAAERQVGQVSDPTALTAIVEEVLQAQAKAARDFQTGNDRALGALIGGVMARTRGLANPQLVDSLLRERLPRDPGP
ncbi:MAG TPA: Asp-tRNA(Asn)/Glu-tRNA(Gln) amidotransferase GatCAB subunit B, partial [Candidatus Dormibacteraeota bacterium]|nr:Asp-tRNA(Asn)/Glu-tRNA(Gln) amidotransferase GatCAB subunit B [Candidatus Dormibacteraeota bacterium]